MTSNQAVALKVDVESLVNNLKFAFTNQTTFLAELMQNARRAGATGISFRYSKEDGRLIVRDDGCGIQNLQTILTIAKSGWDKEVVDDEHPYGMGFMAALYTAERITIRSHGKRISFLRDDVLSFTKIPVKDAEYCPGVEIILEGITLSENEVGRMIAHYASGFPIPVFYNDKEMERPYALDGGLDFIETEVGLIHLPEISLDPVTKAEFTRATRVLGEYGATAYYLQGLPVNDEGKSLRSGVRVVHLSNGEYRGRLPDRNQVINSDKMKSDVDRVTTKLWSDRLEALKATIDPKTFARIMFPTLKKWRRTDLLNDVPFIPPAALGVLTSFPLIIHEWDSNVEIGIEKCVSREDIESKRVLIVEPDQTGPGEGESFHVLTYLSEVTNKKSGQEVYVYADPIHEDHWLNKHVIELNEENVSVEFEGNVRHEPYEAKNLYCAGVINVTFADKVVLNGPLGQIAAQLPFYYSEDSSDIGGGQIIVPEAHTMWPLVIRQVSSFMDGFAFQEMEAEEEIANFRLFLAAQSAESGEAVLERLLGELMLTNFASLRGKTFQITIPESYDDGRLEIKQVKKS